MSELKRAIVRGTFWSALSTFFSRGLRFLVTIVLARLLLPVDFGLVAMSSLVMDVAELLSDLGLGAALIQRKRLDDQHLVTCFWANQAMGAVLWVLTTAASPLIAGFYHNPSVQPVLSVMAFNFLIAPIGSVPWVLLNRELRFKELMIAQSVATVVRGGVSLVLAWHGFGVWSLVWGPLAGTASGSIINWGFCRWRPKFGWSWSHFRELFRFGRNVFGERFLGYFSANTDYIVTGRVLGATTLGIYNFSYQLPHLVETHLAPIVNRVLFPILSRVQDDRERLRCVYLQSLRWIAIVSVPCSVGLFVVAPELVPFIYGAKWQGVVQPLQILCLAGLLHALTTTVWMLQQAIGKPGIGFAWNAATVPLIVVTLIFSSRWGIIGIAVTMLIVSVTLSLAIQHITNRLIGLSWARWIATVRPAVVAAIGMGLIVAAGRWMMLSEACPSTVAVGISIVLGIVSYALLLIWQDRAVLDELGGFFGRKSKPAPQTVTPRVTASASL